ncbi:MAG: hypothetical protein M3R65_01250 [Gemmatimonadota bacterium]|nr:hypothetical protein [Gemmatimonadota bacterium]
MKNTVLDMAARIRRAVVPVSAALAVTLSLAACVHAPPAGDFGGRSLLTEDEIDAAHVFNAYEAVYKLRQEFLVSRGKLTLDPTVPPALPNVYVDHQFYGDVTTLKGIPAGNVESIAFMSSSESQYKYGRGNAAGVIDVTTKH